MPRRTEFESLTAKMEFNLNYFFFLQSSASCNGTKKTSNKNETW